MNDEELRRYFADRLPARLAEIEEALAAARAAGWTGEPLRTAHRLAHSLKGAGETFGFPEVSAAGRELERMLAGAVGEEEEKKIGEVVGRLRRAAPGTAGVPPATN
ncbi:MAG TPA: Hpt domain-containing protein [Thermoanaerobaculia bacterium]